MVEGAGAYAGGAFLKIPAVRELGFLSLKARRRNTSRMRRGVRIVRDVLRRRPSDGAADLKSGPPRLAMLLSL